MKFKTTIFAVLLAAAILQPGAARSEVWTNPDWITELNSGSRDLEPWISADGKTVYFSSDRTGSLELYVSHLQDSGLWSAPERLPEPINDPLARDGHPSLTLDGRYLYFHSNRPSPYNAGKEYQWRACDIWVSENIGGIWQFPQVLGPNVNSTMMDYAPYISVDGQYMMFASDRPGGYGQHDFYSSHKTGGEWQPAQNMGSPINSSLNQVHPSLSYTGRFLFLSDLSNIYRSEWGGSSWQAPVKLPAPVNNCTSGTESSIYNDCTNTLYYYKMCSPGGSWDMATAEWLDAPEDNPCDHLIIPDGQWRVRVTLLEASAVLKNDIYIDAPISDLLIRNSLKNVGSVVSTPFISADSLTFSIHINGDPMGLGHYVHSSNSEFARVRRTDPLRYLVGFEDLPAHLADWDFNDTVLLVELVGIEVNIWEGVNYLGETQVVREAPAGQDLDTGVALTKGLALNAAVNVPAEALPETTFSIVTEGDPGLYSEILADAPFTPTGDFLKLELTNGQKTLANGKQAGITIDYIDDDNDGIVDGTSISEDNLQVFKFNAETGAWEQLPAAADPALNLITAETGDLSLLALGGVAPDPLMPKPPTPITDSEKMRLPKSHQLEDGLPLGCVISGAPAAAANLLLVLALALAPAVLLRRLR